MSLSYPGAAASASHYAMTAYACDVRPTPPYE